MPSLQTPRGVWLKLVRGACEDDAGEEVRRDEYVRAVIRKPSGELSTFLVSVTGGCRALFKGLVVSCAGRHIAWHEGAFVITKLHDNTRGVDQPW